MAAQQTGHAFECAADVAATDDGLRLECDERGNRIVGETLLILFNSRHEGVNFTLPSHRPQERWVPLLDTSVKNVPNAWLGAGEQYPLRAHSLVVLQLKRGWSRLHNLLHGSHKLPSAGHLGEAEDESPPARPAG